MNLTCSSRSWSICGGSFSISSPVLRISLVEQGDAAGRGLGALEQLHRFLLELGDALGVARALLDQEGNLACALLDLLGQAADLVAHAHDQFAEALVLDHAHLDRLLQAGDARQFAAHLADLAAEHLAVAHAGAFQLALAGHAFFVGTFHQAHQFGLGVGDRLLDLVKAGQLRLRAGQAPFQFLNAARLLDDVGRLRLDALLQTGNLGAIAPVLFVQPGHHLGELC